MVASSARSRKNRMVAGGVGEVAGGVGRWVGMVKRGRFGLIGKSKGFGKEWRLPWETVLFYLPIKSG